MGNKIICILLLTLLLGVLISVFINNIYENNNVGDAKNILERSTNFITNINNNIQLKLENMQTTYTEGIYTEPVNETNTEENKINENTTEKKETKIEEKKNKPSNQTKQESQNNTNKNSADKNNKSTTLNIKGDDTKHPIRGDEGQWYTESDWFEIDGDMISIEN